MVFLIVLFLAEKTSFFSKTINYALGKDENGLIYNNSTVAEIVYKDTDGDGVPDWEENLYGTDPTKKETTPGIPDSVAIAKLKAEQGGDVSSTSGGGQGVENLTETDKFSRELFSSVSALSQNGAMDQTTVDKISTSLTEHIKNLVPRKIFTLSDIKITSDNNIKSIKNYSDSLKDVQKKYPDKGSAMDILKKFIIDDNNVDASALSGLSPIIDQSQNQINAVIKLKVPQSLSSLHLDFLNSGERLLENMIDMQLFDTDPIVAMGAMSKYKDNMISFQTAYTLLTDTINKKLRN